MPFSSGEFAWNSVDVRGDDGLLHNGRVIDAVEAGLVVHFGEQGPFVPQLVPFGQVYHSIFSDYMPRSGHRIDEGLKKMPARPVEVLLHLQPEEPWKWYPAMLLDTFGLVRVSLPDRELEGFLVHHRIRLRTTEERLDWGRVQKGRFSKKLIVVPSEYGVPLPSDNQMIGIFNAHCQTRCYWMMATQVHHNANKKPPILELFCGPRVLDYDEGVPLSAYHCIRTPYPEDLDKILTSLLKSGTHALEDSRTLSTETPYPDGDIQSLFCNRCIFPQIFECLPTIHQTKIRGVCKKWDRILISAYIRRVVSVFQPSYTPDYAVAVYRFASCLYNCWTPQTRVLVLYGQRTPDTCESRLVSPARLVQRIMTDKKLPPVDVVLLTGEWDFRVHSPNPVNALWAVFVTLAGIGQQVILKDFAVNINLTRSYQCDQEFVTLRFATQRMTRHMTAKDFWAMLNNGLGGLSAHDMERLQEWITAPPMTYPWQITQVLNTTQTLDPRDGVRYRGLRFNAYGEAGLDKVHVRHLTKLTLHALFQRYEANKKSEHSLHTL